MDDLTTAQGILPLVAAAVAAVTLVLAIVLAVKLRRLRRAQHAVLGSSGSQDLVTHAARLQQEFRALRDYVDDLAGRLDKRVRHAEARLDGAIAHRALVRYDAYGELSGQQSTSIALLDSGGSGIVLSSIHHRDQARVYAKQVVDGQAQLELSPEEEEAMRVALAGEAPDA